MSNLSPSSSSSENAFGFGTRLGIFLSFEAALLSAVSASVVLCYTGHKLIMKLRARQAIKKLHSGIVLPPIDATDSLGFVGLMFAELIQALGGLLNMRWVVDGFITEGSLCEAQGHLKQIGDVGVALFSLFIAFDTFFMLVFSWRASRAVSLGGLIGICLFIVLVVAIGSGINHGKSPAYIGNTGYWCWISATYTPYRIALEYLWMWTAALLMLILYGIIALVMHGSLVAEGRRLRFRSANSEKPREVGYDVDESRSHSQDSEDERENKEIANMMLFYPAIYIACVLPVSIVRWIDFTNSSSSPTTISPGGIIFASIVFQLSGLFNVLLFKFTRPALVSGQNFDSGVVVGAESELHSESPGHGHDHEKLHHDRGQAVVRKRTGLGVLPEDVEASGAVMAEGETPAARYARTATTITVTPSVNASAGTRPMTQESALSGRSGGVLPDI
ncbi:hypothetical protein D9756_003073 [Leucocoprinus leucothites]|uniref:Glucose receptor Git3 N-terminal domain-containing protein n=1 Tax=Leucocoprinus leucothites TaxID=201217 RepID=A0A8H5LJF1_9AGAR|nr:hypothetical protein D9756_003073 [Leucoagaricus leucothites]